MQRGGLVVLHVHADLDEARPRQVESERAHAREPAARLSHNRGDRAGNLELAAQVHVERDQRPPRAHDDASGGRMKLGRTEVGRHLPAREPALELLGPTAPEERRPARGSDLAVEEDG